MLGERRGYIELILFSIFVGSVGTFVKLVQNIDVYSLVFFRYAIATLFVLAIILCRKKAKELYPVLPFKTLLTGLFLGVASLFYFSSIVRTSVSNAVFLLYTAPIFSVILAKVFVKEDIEKDTILGMCITLAGIIFILDPRTFSFSSEQTLGNLFGLCAGFLYAAQGLVAQPVTKKVSGYYVAFWQSFIISIMFLFFLNTTKAIALQNWWQLLALGILCAGIPAILFMEGVKKVKAQKIFIITSLEPLAGTAFALLILWEIPSIMTIIGAILIFYGVFRVTKTNKK